MKRVMLLLLGLLLIAILTYFCFITKADGIREDLVSKTQAVYKDKNIDWINVAPVGSDLESTRDIVLTGTAPTKEKKREAQLLAEGVYGVANVDNQLVIKKPTVVKVVAPKPIEKAPQKPKAVVPSPYQIAVVKDKDNKIELNGYVDNANDHKEIVDEAVKLFGVDNVTDNLKEIKGSPTLWVDSTKLSLNKLSQLEYGEFTINDRDLEFKGYAPKQEVKDDILASMSTTLNSEYHGNYVIDVSEVEPAKAAQYCEDSFRDLLKNEKINFKYNKAIVSKKSYLLLDKIVNIAKECPNSTITVEGHTDSKGREAYNQWLSKARANAVKAYLLEHSIEPSRLKAVGYGELRPIASNATESGRAKNRRIEFNVKGAK